MNFERMFLAAAPTEAFSHDKEECSGMNDGETQLTFFGTLTLERLS